jgi:STE24 endopeptidase
MEDFILYVIIGIIVFEFLLERYLEWLNLKSHESQLPPALKGLYEEEKYAQSQRYSQEKARLGAISGLVGFVVLLGMLLTGGFGLIGQWIELHIEHPIWVALAFFGLVGLGADLIGLPFAWYATFVIEEKYGFNRTTAKIFVADKLKEWLLGSLLGGGLLALFIWFHDAFPYYYWLYAWGIFFAFTLFLTMFYTNVLAPIFNKLTPLEDGALRQAIESYAHKVGFPLSKIMVMDGSKRSTKGNAYFSGLGGAKNIVLFDTLIEKHTQEELVAILAHEVGHYKKKHTLQALVLSALIMLLTLYVLQLVVDNPALSVALGGESSRIYLGIIAFSILYSPLSTITGLMMNVFSRKNEFEADAFACATYPAESLVNALVKLSADTLSNLKPHPAYVFFYYSHPPLLQRLEAMKAATIENPTT